MAKLNMKTVGTGLIVLSCVSACLFAVVRKSINLASSPVPAEAGVAAVEASLSAPVALPSDSPPVLD